MIFLDTNFLIAGLTPGSLQSQCLQQWLDAGEQLRVCLLVWTEFLCGPVAPEQIEIATIMVNQPVTHAVEDARRAADLFNATGRRRGSLSDCLIAATCLGLGAPIATENIDDFRRFEPMGLKILSTT